MLNIYVMLPKWDGEILCDQKVALVWKSSWLTHLTFYREIVYCAYLHCGIRGPWEHVLSVDWLGDLQDRYYANVPTDGTNVLQRRDVIYLDILIVCACRGWGVRKLVVQVHNFWIPWYHLHLSYPIPSKHLIFQLSSFTASDESWGMRTRLPTTSICTLIWQVHAFRNHDSY